MTTGIVKVTSKKALVKLSTLSIQYLDKIPIKTVKSGGDNYDITTIPSHIV